MPHTAFRLGAALVLLAPYGCEAISASTRNESSIFPETSSFRGLETAVSPGRSWMQRRMDAWRDGGMRGLMDAGRLALGLDYQDDAVMDGSSKTNEEYTAPLSSGDRAQQIWNWSGMLFVTVMFAIVLLILFLSYMKGSTSRSCGSNAKLLLLSVAVLDGLNFSSFFADSLQLAVAVGADFTFSGWMISIYKTATFLFMLVLWFHFRRNPEVRLVMDLKVTVCSSVTIMMACNALMAYGLWNVFPTSSASLKWFVLAMRFTLGGAGSIAFVVNQAFTLLSSPTERTGWFMHLSCLNMLGIGLGPILASVAHSLLDGYVPIFASVPLTLVCLEAAVLTFLVLHFPPLENADTYVDVAPGSHAGESALNVSHTIVAACLLFGGLRAFSLASVEAATSMILQTEFGWHSANMGLVIGTTFLMCIPFQCIFQWLRRRNARPIDLLRSLMALTLIGTLLFAPQLGQKLKRFGGDASLAWLVLLGDALLFPSFFLANGMTDALMMNNVSQEGIFTRENTILMQKFMVDFVGRTLGPPLVRTVLSSGDSHTSRFSYVLVQILVALVAWISLELVADGSLLVAGTTTKSNPGNTNTQGPLENGSRDRTTTPGAMVTMTTNCSWVRNQNPCPSLLQKLTSEKEAWELLSMPVFSLMFQVIGIMLMMTKTTIIQDGMLGTAIFYGTAMAALMLSTHAACGLIKDQWLRMLGFSGSEIEMATSLQELPLSNMKSEYGNYSIMVADGVTRKTAHIVFNIIKMYTWTAVIHGADMTIACTLFAYSLIISTLLVALPLDAEFTNKLCWGVNRIRDGKYRRWNFINACSGSGLAAVISFLFWFQLLLPAVTTEPVQKALLLVLWIPLGVGDAVAEIVGVLFGRHRFQVYGLGECNDKSVEGCVGMFCSTLFASLYVVRSHGLLSWDWLVMLLTIAAVTTALETWTPRGHDNCTITLGAGASALLCLHAGMGLN